MKKLTRLKPLFYFSLCLFVSTTSLIGLLSFIIHSRYRARIYDQTHIIPANATPRIAIVLGAGLWRNGSPTPILYDRVASAVALYQAGRATKLLMSGERNGDYNEPLAMMRLAQSLGVSEADLVPDYAGLRTYDSCYRAKEVFGVTRAVVVTQRFHLDRAMYLCDRLGLDAIGYAADRRRFAPPLEAYWQLREYFSTVLAVLDVNVLHPEPELEEQMPIE